MEGPSEADTVGRTVRLTGFENEEYTHRCLLSSCVRSLAVAGSRIRPAVVGVFYLSSGWWSPQTRSDYFSIDPDVGRARRIYKVSLLSPKANLPTLLSAEL